MHLFSHSHFSFYLVVFSHSLAKLLPMESCCFTPLKVLSHQWAIKQQATILHLQPGTKRFLIPFVWRRIVFSFPCHKLTFFLLSFSMNEILYLWYSVLQASIWLLVFFIKAGQAIHTHRQQQKSSLHTYSISGKLQVRRVTCRMLV